MKLRHLITGLLVAAAGFPATAMAGDFRVNVSYGHSRHHAHPRRTVVRHVAPSRIRLGHGHVHHHDPCYRVPAHYRVHRERVYVAGRYDYERIPAVYEDHWDTHHRAWAKHEIRPATVRKTWIPAHYVIRRHKKWVRARWVCHRS